MLKFKHCTMLVFYHFIKTGTLLFLDDAGLCRAGVFDSWVGSMLQPAWSSSGHTCRLEGLNLSAFTKLKNQLVLFLDLLPGDQTHGMGSAYCNRNDTRRARILVTISEKINFNWQRLHFWEIRNT